jgi:Ala-tRNA(Pro) deacylase
MPADTHADPRGGAAAVHERLAGRGIDHEIIEHPPTYTAVAEAEAVGAPGGGVAKTVVAVDGDQVWLAVVPASRRLDLRRFRQHTGASHHLRLATEREIAARFADYDVGATPPLGQLIGAPEVVDPLVLAHASIVCPAGDHEHALRLSADALMAAAEPEVADISSHPDESRRTRFADVPLH